MSGLKVAVVKSGGLWCFGGEARGGMCCFAWI